MAQEEQAVQPVVQQYDDAQRESAHENSVQPVVAEMVERNVNDPAPEGSRARSPHSVQGQCMEAQPNANQSFQIPVRGNPTAEIPRREAVAGIAMNIDNPMMAMIQGLFDRLDQRNSGNNPGEPAIQPTFLKVVTTMKNLGTFSFNGGYDPLEADAWIQSLEKNFEATRCLEEYKLDVAVYYLEKDALNWWRNFSTYFGDQQPTWDQFKTEFRRKYFPREARERLETQFMNLSQGSRSVREYEAEFARLRKYAHYGPHQEEMIVSKFKRGLRADIKSRLQVVEIRELNELVERAVNVEEGIAEERASNNQMLMHRRSGMSRQEFARPRHQGGKLFGRGNFHRDSRKIDKGGSSSGGRFGNSGRNMDSPRNVMTCFQCGRTGHTRNYCPMRQQRPMPSFVRCYQCGEQGHYANNCPRNQPMPIRSLPPPANEQRAIEPAPKRPAITGRIYTMGVDKPEPSRPTHGLITGMFGR